MVPLGIVGLVVNAQNQSDVLILGGGRNDDLVDGIAEMGGRFGGIREAAGRFNYQVGIHHAPRDLGGVTLGKDADGVPIDDDGVCRHVHLTWVGAVVGVVLEEIGVGGRIADVVDGHHLQLTWITFQDGAQGEPPDSSKAVDPDMLHAVLQWLDRSAARQVYADPHNSSFGGTSWRSGGELIPACQWAVS